MDSIGKLPPQAKDLEQAVLGAILIEKEAYDEAYDILKPDMFYLDGHRAIFEAMIRLAKKSQPIDIPLVAEELRVTEQLDLVGGEGYLAKLTTHVVSSAHLRPHAQIILQKYVNRRLIQICGDVIKDAYQESTDPFELMDQTEAAFSNLGESFSFGGMVGIDTVLVQAMTEIVKWRQNDSSITGIPSGYRELDKATRGWQNGDLIIIAARPSVGKTALALNLIRNAATFLQNKGSNASVAVWSLEMKVLFLVLRMIAADSEEVLYNIQTGRLGDEQMKNIYARAIQKLSRLSIFFDDSSGLTIQKLRTKARKLKRKNALSLIVVDYLQLMTPEEKSGNREQEVSKISRSLKNLAQELNIPIIALSQLSREVERRTGVHRKPQLSDLRESGSLEQDADLVMFLWAPSEEDIQLDSSLINRRYLRIAKQRNGHLITQEFDFRDEIQLFTELSAGIIATGLGTGSWRPVSSSEKDDKLPFH